MPTKTKGERKAEQILKAAISIAIAPGGWALLTRQRIAERAGCPQSLVSLYQGDMKTARLTVMSKLSERQLMRSLGK